MFADTGPVIVEERKCACGPVSIKQVQHRDFPQLHTEAASVAEGVASLAGLLSQTWDCARGRRRRALMEQAIADLADFFMSLEEVDPSCLSNPAGRR